MNRVMTVVKRSGGPLAIAVLVLAALVFGWLARGCIAPGEPAAADKGTAKAGGEDEAEQLWTCSMHPQIKLPEPGLCPICGMELIPLEADDDGAARTFKTSEAAKKLMDVRVHPVERRFVTAEVRMPGKVTYDETRLHRISAWVPGRIDRLYVDFTGISVRAGDHMVYLYSPELYSAQEELLQAIEALKSLERSELGTMKETAKATVEAAREKLRLLGMTKDQIKQVEQRGSANDHVTIYAPSGGIVVKRHADEGQYVRTGSSIYTIADLNHLWVMLDAYETDLPWLHYGQEVQFIAKGYPGETFVGKIAFISPVVDDETRTVRVRVNVPNPGMKLKPDMFVEGIVKSKLATGGRVMAPDLAGKWMCRMHPSVVKESAGECDICGMPLSRTETLGYVAAESKLRDRPLVIPKSAPLITGKRAVVYVQDPTADEPAYVGRTIKLGPRAGDWYIVEDGLADGELVVTHGNFKIDSALQIQAEKSMMSLDDADVPEHAKVERTEAVEYDA
ncbi:MAG: efflux RND transporter periplasmic adaptor subunit, partial [Planctomycetota bacterium]